MFMKLFVALLQLFTVSLPSFLKFKKWGFFFFLSFFFVLSGILCEHKKLPILTVKCYYEYSQIRIVNYCLKHVHDV